MPFGGTGGGPGSSVGGAAGDNGRSGGGGRGFTSYGGTAAQNAENNRNADHYGGMFGGGTESRQSNGGNDRGGNGNRSSGSRSTSTNTAAAQRAAAAAQAAAAEAARQQAIAREQQRVAQVQQITQETQQSIQTYTEQQALYNQAINDALAHKAQAERTTAGFNWSGALKDAGIGALMGFFSGGPGSAVVGAAAALGKDFASYAMDTWGSKAVTDPAAKVNAAVANGTMRPDEAAKALAGFNPLNNGRVAGSMLDARTGPGGVFSNPTRAGGNNNNAPNYANAPAAPAPAAPAPQDVQAQKAIGTIIPTAAKSAAQANDRGTKSYMAELRQRYNAASLLGGNAGVNTSLLGQTAGGRGALGGTQGRLLTTLGGGGNLLGGAAWQ